MFSTFGSLEKEDKYIEGIIQSVFGQDNPDGMLYQYRELSSSTHPTEIECAGQPVTDMIVESTTGETVQKTDFTETKSLSPDSTQHPSSSTCDTESKPVTKFYLPPCKTCNVQQSTGLHYGVHTCNACKGFFRRCFSQSKSIKPCKQNYKCEATANGKISCMSCRYQKCLDAGMTKEGSRKGRYTHAMRTEHTKEFKSLQTKQEAHTTLESVMVAFHKSFLVLTYFFANKEIIYKRLRLELDTLRASVKVGQSCGLVYCPGDAICPEMKQEREIVKKAYAVITARDYDIGAKDHHQKLTSDPELVDAVKATREGWVKIVEERFKEIVAFAKNLPGFTSLCMDDRITLLKAARVETSVLIVDSLQYGDKDFGWFCIHPQPESEEIYLAPTDEMRRCLMGETIFSYIAMTMQRVRKCKFTEEDVAVFMGLVILSPDRDGLKDREAVEKMQETLLKALHYTLEKNHPDDPSILANALLLLPMLRETNAKNERRSKKTFVDQLQLELPPLLKEVVTLNGNKKGDAHNTGVN